MTRKQKQGSGVTILLMTLLFLTACAAERASYHLYDGNSYKGETGQISTSRELIITVVDSYPISYYLKKYHGIGNDSFSRLYDCYLPPGEHSIKVQCRSGYNITLYGDFAFKVLIEAGHKYMVGWEDKNRRKAAVHITDLTTGEKVGAIQ